MRQVKAIKSELGTIYRDDKTNELFWSKSSLANAAKQDGIKLLNYWINGGKITVETAEILTAQGIRMGEIVPVLKSKANKFIRKFNEELADKIEDLGWVTYFESITGQSLDESPTVNELVEEIRELIRNYHRSVYYKQITGSEANALHKEAYGMTVGEHIALIPQLALLIDPKADVVLLPDVASFQLLKDVTNLRADYVRLKKQGRDRKSARKAAAARLKA